MAGDIVLCARAVSHSYGARQVLGPVSLALRQGEIVALLGPSGAGKSTLLRLLAGVGKADHGQILLNGRPVVANPQNVAMVFQSYALFPWRTALGNVEYPLQIAGMARRERQRQARMALAEVGLADAAGLFPHQLSGGMQQRVALARSIVARPAVMLLDEPLSALDPVTRSQLRGQLARLFERSACTVLMVTHDVEEAVALAGRVVLIAGAPGTIVADYDVCGGARQAHVAALDALLAAHHKG